MGSNLRIAIFNHSKLHMNNQEYAVRDTKLIEFQEVGALMVEVYTRLGGFPSPDEQPSYCKMLANIGSLTGNPKARLIVAVTPRGEIRGGVVYFGDMQYYGSGGIASTEKNAGGFRLLAVDLEVRGKGLGKLLTEACIEIAKEEKQPQLIIHSTKACKFLENV